MSAVELSSVKDLGLADAGHMAIDWAKRHSPLVDGFLRARLSDGALDGRRVAVVVHLEAKTAFLATVLADAGAHVVAAGSNPHSTRDEIAAALVERGVEVHAVRNSGYELWEKHLLAVGAAEPEFIIDDGAELTLRMAKLNPEQYLALGGVSEQTTTGVMRLRNLEANGRLPFAALAANDARCKHLFDNKYGTGQSTVQAILNLTNMLLPGKRVAIIGYGWVGKGLASNVRALGGRPIVVETDPVRALEAYMDGHRVAAMADALPDAEFVITATGGVRALNESHFGWLKDGAILANAGHHDLEIDSEALAEGATARTLVREGIEQFSLNGGKEVFLLSSGALVNIAGGLGHPIEIMDLSFAVQGVCCHALASKTWSPGVQSLPKELDDEIAAARLAFEGITLDAPTADQQDTITHWVE